MLWGGVNALASGNQPGQVSTLVRAKTSGILHQVVEQVLLVLYLWLSELKPCRASVTASHQKELIKGSECGGIPTLTPRGVECIGNVH